MSSRVNKGGTVFRPSIKPKGKPPSRQSSSQPDARKSVTPAPSGSMPPPATIPPKHHNMYFRDRSLESEPGSYDVSEMSPTLSIPWTEETRMPRNSPSSLSGPNILTSNDPNHALSRGQSRPTPILVSKTRPPSIVAPPKPPNQTESPHSNPADAGPPINLDPDTETSSLPANNVTTAPEGVAPTSPDASPLLVKARSKPSTKGRKKSTHKASGGSLDTNDGPSAKKRKKTSKRTNFFGASDSEVTLTSSRKNIRSRKSSMASSAEDEDEGDAESTTKSTKRKHGRQLKQTPPPYDPCADLGEELDPTTMTMAQLCDDTGQGRVSSKAAQIQGNHALWKVQSKARRERMTLLAEAKKYGREEGPGTIGVVGNTEDPAAPTDSQDTPRLSNGPESGDTASERPPDVLDANGDSFDYSQNLSTSRYNVQVRIGPNGETIVDEESLFVDRSEETDTANYTQVEESDATKFTNSASYGKKLKGSRWSTMETELFFDALSQFGENYELISYVLPGRDRKQCKNKFKAEDKKNPSRINHCLNNKTPYDTETLSRMTGKDFSGPTPEIRPPPSLATAEGDQSGDDQGTVEKHNARSTPAPVLRDGDEEILGLAEDYDSDK